MSATDWCLPVHSVWTKAVDSLRDEAGSRHESTRDAVRALVALGAEGHRGSKAALADLSRAFTAAVGEERVRSGEWHRLLVGAIQLAAAANPTPLQHCEHDPATAIKAPPGFSMPAATSSLTAAGIAPDLDTIEDELAPLLDYAAKERLLVLIAEFGASLTGTDQGLWRQRFKKLGLPFSQFDDALKSARSERDRVRSEKANAEWEQSGGRLLSPPTNPMEVSRELLAEVPATDGVYHLGYWRADFYEWVDGHWKIKPEADVRTWIYRMTDGARFVKGTDDDPNKKEAWLPNSRKVNSVQDAMGVGVLHREDGKSFDEIIAVRNGVYVPSTDKVELHHPKNWNLSALPFSIPVLADGSIDRESSNAQCPQWLTFLEQVLPPDSIMFLQEWVGYLISGRTDHQKIASLIGLPRSGKGTINRTITSILGRESVTSPTLGSLTGPFGLEPLIGKSLATFADVKWSARGVADATELLKTISGEDSVTVHRKNRVSWDGRLPTRFMLMSNDTPSFSDSSGALGNRLIHVKFTRSFLGREDIGLSERIEQELAGIFLWGLEGLKRLDERGRFYVPMASSEIDEDVRRTASPHLVFIEEVCALGPALRVPLDEVWSAWVRWCDGDGAKAGNKRWLTRKLKSVAPSITTADPRESGGKVKYLVGIELRESDPLAGLAQLLSTANPLREV